MHPRSAALVVFVVLCAAAQPAPAQLYTRPALEWETIRTAHFDVHFPSSMGPWASDVAGRLEVIREAVVAVVGNTPASRVTVMIEDPYNVANGAALPLLNTPTIVLWPTPPEPAGDLGHSPDWPALLAVHEFAHIAHLTWPSRNPFDRAVWQLLPADLGPISRRAPRWVIEGYATYVEGRLTGSGRPNSVVRAGVLRQFAIEGQLPTYSELDANPQYLGGDMAYLVGSAFLEWLVVRQGEASLQHLWRRMTARTNRSFDAAFVGVFGDTPDALYGLFAADVTGKALQAAALIRSWGLDSGQTFQHLSWYTGDPAVAPAGHRIAVPVRQFGEHTRIVVWSTDPAPPDTERAAARARTLALDPGDVASVAVHPDQRAPLAILEASHGRGFDHPRFFADGQRLLVSHDEPLPDGALRPDLFEWNLASGKVRRLTHGAAVRDADPSLAGRTAIGVRCLGGVCDVVLVDLTKGSLRVLLPGSPRRTYYEPRFAPDGRSVIVSVHDGGLWRLEIFPVQPRGLGAPKLVGPSDSASRYGATFVAGRSAVVVVSELGGVQHLEVIDLRTGDARALAATTGGAIAPTAAPGDSVVYFLSLSARGRDLHRIALSTARSIGTPAIPAALAPAAVPMAASADSFPPVSAPPAIPYGWHPREYRYLLGGAIGPEGDYLTLLIGSSDPVGRLAWAAQGSLGDAGTWRGGSLAAAWRGLPVTIDGSLFAVSQFPSRQSAGTFAGDSLDANYVGVVASAGGTSYTSWLVSSARVGASAGGLSLASGPSRLRDLAFASYSGTGDFSRGRFLLQAKLAALGTIGQTEGSGWQRLKAQGSVVAGYKDAVLRYSIVYDQVSNGAPQFEVPVAGGSEPPLTDRALFSQRVSVPALPIGVVSGTQLTDQRLEYGMQSAVIFYERLATPLEHGAVHDLYGGELRVGSPPVPFLAVPAVGFSTGLGYSISEPYKYKLRAFFAVRYSP